MRVRRLQQRLDDEQWEDHGYAYEREDGQVSFRYNTLVWGRIGADYNVKLKKTGANLEAVPTVIPTGDQLRWLEIEEIDGQLEQIKARLDQACKIPRPQRAPVKKPAVA